MSNQQLSTKAAQLQFKSAGFVSILALIGPILFAWVFAAFIDKHRAFQFPGAPWALAASLLVVALTIAAVATRARRPIIAQTQKA